MTDLEITKLCAEAMGIDFSKGYASITCKECEEYGVPYNPLHDDAQAMALVKKLAMTLYRSHEGEWTAKVPYRSDMSRNSNLNRAVCQCAARIQKSKRKQS